MNKYIILILILILIIIILFQIFYSREIENYEDKNIYTVIHGC